MKIYKINIIGIKVIIAEYNVISETKTKYIMKCKDSTMEFPLLKNHVDNFVYDLDGLSHEYYIPDTHIEDVKEHLQYELQKYQAFINESMKQLDEI